MADTERRHLGRVFDEVPELYDRVRPTYPDELFADLVAITGMDERSAVLEVGCGTGQATRSLAGLGCSVTAVEPGTAMAALARQRLATSTNVEIETSSFEEWDDRVGASTSWWRRRRGTGSTRRSAGAEPTRCSTPVAGWRCSATSSSAGPASPRSTPRPPISTSASRPATPTGVIRPSRTRCAPTDEGWGPPNDPGALFGPTDRAVVSDGAVVRRRGLRRPPPLDVAVPEARPRRARAAARRHRRTHPHADGRQGIPPLPERPPGRPALPTDP